LRKIKNKIMGSVILIVTLSLTAISIFAYIQFSSILERQTLAEGLAFLEQTNNQINQQIDDVYKYSANMVNDGLLMDFASQTHYDSTFDEIYAFRQVVTQLQKFNVLRDYLQSSAIVRSDGKVFWSSISLDPYFDQLLQEDWYKQAIRTEAKSGFTIPHSIQDKGMKEVISFFIRFDPQIGGVLLLNIDYQAFAQLFDVLGRSFDQYAWINNGQSFILNQGIAEDTLAEVTQSDPAGTINVVTQQKGYYMTSTFDKTGWSVITFTSKERFYELLRYVIKYWAAFLVLGLFICFLLFLPIISSIMRPIAQMSKAMKQVSLGNYNVQLSFQSNDELSVLRNGFEKMLEDIQQQMADKVEHEQWKRKMSAELLFAQINPHFIYNTLNTVVYLARKGNNQAVEELVESFIGILHDAVKIGESELFVSVEQEKLIIDQYVRIQQYRYADSFDLSWHIEEETLAVHIPRSLIQPLVENAIFHGFSDYVKTGHITITIQRDENYLQITVTDNGNGISEDQQVSLEQRSATQETKARSGMKHIGLRNIRDRIDYLYGEIGKLEITSKEGEGTVITIRLPLFKHFSVQEDKTITF
jgi:two-component system sensor histidine kinase YesM